MHVCVRVSNTHQRNCTQIHSHVHTYIRTNTHTPTNMQSLYRLVNFTWDTHTKQTFKPLYTNELHVLRTPQTTDTILSPPVSAFWRWERQPSETNASICEFVHAVCDTLMQCCYYCSHFPQYALHTHADIVLPCILMQTYIHRYSSDMQDWKYCFGRELSLWKWKLSL